MRIIISPAKKMAADTDTLPAEGLPAFLAHTERLKTALQGMSRQELQSLWKCNDAITAQNAARLADMNLHRRLTPAVLAYEGIQYQYMAPRVMEIPQLDYLREHLRILSGFYGLLRPFDGVTPYRLEMQARLQVDGCRDLYAFWGDHLAGQLAAETDFVLNLASKEYSRAVEPHLPRSFRFVSCRFGQRRGGKVVETGTTCKMARGQMVRWLAEYHVTDLEGVRAFDQLGYRFCPELSAEDCCVFLSADTEQPSGAEA